jgi:hypothetical protein
LLGFDDTVVVNAEIGSGKLADVARRFGREGRACARSASSKQSLARFVTTAARSPR